MALLDDRDGEVSFASLADVTGDISLGSIDDIKVLQYVV